MYKRRYRRKRKRTYKRKSRAVSQQRNWNVPTRSLLGNSRAVKLKYVEVTTIPVVAGLPGLLSFRIMNIFDPLASGGGHQPRGFDQLEPLYGKYCVLGAKCTVNFMPNNTQHANIQYIQTSTDQAVTLINPVDALEDRQVVSKPWSPGGGIGSKQVLVSKFSTKKFFNKVDVLDDPHLAGGTNGIAPATNAFFNVSNSPAHAAPTFQHTDCIVVIDYFVVFSDPTNPLGS